MAISMQFASNYQNVHSIAPAAALWSKGLSSLTVPECPWRLWDHQQEQTDREQSDRAPKLRSAASHHC